MSLLGLPLVFRAIVVAFLALSFVPSSFGQDDMSAEQKWASAGPYVGKWEGKGPCSKGPHRFVLNVYDQPHANGFNARLTVIPEHAAQADDPTFWGHFYDTGAKSRAIHFDPDPASVRTSLGRKPAAFFGDASKRGYLDVRVDVVGCLQVGLERAAQVPDEAGAVRVAEVPDAFKAYEGAWDGAIYDDGAMYEVAFTIAPAKAGSENRVFDVAVVLDGRSGEVALSGDSSGNLDIANIFVDGKVGAVALRGSIRSEVLNAGGRDYFTFTVQGDADGFGFVARRPPERGTQPLQQVCDERVDTWAADRNEARDLARNLRIVFYPALASYDEDRAALGDALAGIGTDAGGIAAFATAVVDCVATSPNFDAYRSRRLFDDLVNMDDLAEARARMARRGEAESLVTGNKGTTGLMETAVRIAEAEAEVAALMVDAGRLTHVEDILGFLETNAERLSDVRPSVLKELLAPLAANLARAEAATAEELLAQRQTAAEERLRGVDTPPGVPVDRFAELMSGRKSAFSGDEISYFGGFIAGSIEDCDLPRDLPARFVLAGLFAQGTARTLGSEFATGDLLVTLQSTLAGTSAYVAGSRLPKEVGCKAPFLGAALEALVDAASARGLTGSGRASLFIRSCALDRNEGQCHCMVPHLQTVIPDIDYQRYDREQLVALIRGNPSVALTMGPACQVSDY